MKEILIFGHQNPDTDTIMSSIAMANLENKKGNNVVACKLGGINKETNEISWDNDCTSEQKTPEDCEYIGPVHSGLTVINFEPFYNPPLSHHHL